MSASLPLSCLITDTLNSPNDLLSQEYTAEEISGKSQLPCTSTVRPLWGTIIWLAISIRYITKCLSELEFNRQFEFKPSCCPAWQVLLLSWLSHPFLHRELRSVRGSRNASVQSPSCECAQHAQSRWCSSHRYGCEESGLSGTSALGRCWVALHCQGRATPHHALKQHFRHRKENGNSSWNKEFPGLGGAMEMEQVAINTILGHLKFQNWNLFELSAC